MLKLLGSLIKILTISSIALFLGNILVVGDKTLSSHFANAVNFLGLKPVQVAKGVDALKEIPDEAADAAGAIKRAWDGVPKGSEVIRNSESALRKVGNPHMEDHPPAAQRDLKKMLNDLRESTESRKKELEKALR